MKLTQTEKVMIYANALQGALIAGVPIGQMHNYTEGTVVATNWALELIETLEAQGEQPNPHEPITD